MPEQLCISVRFLDNAFHGRSDQGFPEWPPSPLRLYQAVVAAAAARWAAADASTVASSGEARKICHAAAALRWLENCPPPVIVASEPSEIKANGYRLYVPDNVGDLVAQSWSRGGEGSLADYRTEKNVRPTLLNEENVAYYLWPLEGESAVAFSEHRDVLFEAVRFITHLGWGVDLVVANAVLLEDDAVKKLAGQRWQQTGFSGGRQLRLPIPGTFDVLEARHRAFLNRINVSEEVFNPVPPLTRFAVATYRRDTETAAPPYAVFALREINDSKYAVFNTLRRGLHVGGMMRYVASTDAFARALGWDKARVRAFVLGHGEEQDAAPLPVQGPRLVFIPLPSIEWRGKANAIGDIRRVLVTVSGTCDPQEFQRIIRQLEGQELIDEKEGEAVAFLRRQSEDDGAIVRYFDKAATWTSVTPVILPGYDDPRKLRQRLSPENEVKLTAEEKAEVVRRLDKRIEHLLRKAIRQAGYPEALAEHAEIEWRGAGFLPGVDLPTRYAIPDQHRRFRRVHLRITWRDLHGNPLRISGPICLGGGKFSGVGLFCSVS